jgi:hypothetical protein
MELVNEDREAVTEVVLQFAPQSCEKSKLNAALAWLDA